MTTPFGPQLIGETEKTLNALLRRFLEPTDLGEPQWVTLRIALACSDSIRDDAALAGAVRDRAHFADADRLVAELGERGLLDGGVPTQAGRDLVAGIQARIAEETRPIWEALPPEELAATTRVLNEVLRRARTVLARLDGDT